MNSISLARMTPKSLSHADDSDVHSLEWLILFMYANHRTSLTPDRVPDLEVWTGKLRARRCPPYKLFGYGVRM